MKGVAGGGIKKKGLSEKEADEFVAGQSPKGLPKKIGKGEDVGVGADKSKKSPPKSKKAAPARKATSRKASSEKIAPKTPAGPPVNPNATGMAQIPYGQQVVPRPAGMSSLGIGSSKGVTPAGHVRQPNPMLAARRPNRTKGPGMMKLSTEPKASRQTLGVGSDAAEDQKMSKSELKKDIAEDKAILKKK